MRKGKGKKKGQKVPHGKEEGTRGQRKRRCSMAEQLSRLQAMRYPLAKAGGYGLKQLQPMQSPHWSREKNDEEGVAKRSC